MKTTKIKLNKLVHADSGKPIVLTVPVSKVKELRAVGRAAKKQGKALRIALDKAIKDDLPSEVLPTSNDAGHCRVAKPSETKEYFDKRFNEIK